MDIKDTTLKIKIKQDVINSGLDSKEKKSSKFKAQWLKRSTTIHRRRGNGKIHCCQDVEETQWRQNKSLCNKWCWLLLLNSQDDFPIDSSSCRFLTDDVGGKFSWTLLLCLSAAFCPLDDLSKILPLSLWVTYEFKKAKKQPLRFSQKSSICVATMEWNKN